MRPKNKTTSNSVFALQKISKKNDVVVQ